ncbi:MAG: trigger factor [Rikenellaceae bacterium]
MNVTFEQQADQSAIITVEVAAADYAAEVEKTLKGYKKQAKVPGFRPGMVPMTIINKMYRKGAVAEQAYKQASQSAFEYINENKIETLGDLMPSDKQAELDFDSQVDFEFKFEIGLAPEFTIALSADDSVEKITVTPTAEMLESYTENFLRKYGKLADVEVVEKEEALNVNLDNPDMKIEDAYVGLISMNDDERAPFIGKKVGDKMQVNINELYKDAKQRAAILSVNEEELEGVNPEFELEIIQIRAFKSPELNDEFFAEAFPEKDITSKEQFDAKMSADIQVELDSQTVMGFYNTVRDMLVEKVNPTLPEAFLKSWLLQINEGKFTMEQIEEEFPQFALMMKWDIIKRYFAKENNIEINNEDMEAEAKNMALQQFKYYGMANPADDMLENFSKQILSNKEEARKIYDRLGDTKIIDLVVSQITVNDKSMSVDEYSAMMQLSK